MQVCKAPKLLKVNNKRIETSSDEESSNITKNLINIFENSVKTNNKDNKKVKINTNNDVKIKNNLIKSSTKESTIYQENKCIITIIHIIISNTFAHQYYFTK
jgi:hypothetical protein